jgi:Domain of unknown function (DUF4760)
MQQSGISADVANVGVRPVCQVICVFHEAIKLRSEHSTADNQPMPPTPTQTPLPSPTVVVNLPSDVIKKLTQHDPSPNWAEQWTAIGTLALVFTAIVAGVFTYFGIRQARGIQHAQTLLEISRRWNERTFREGRIRVRDFYDANKDPKEVTANLLKLKDDSERQYWESLMTLDFFEIMAMNIKYRSITFEMVYDVFGSVVSLYWTILSDHVNKLHESDPNSKRYYIEFENLANQMTEYNRIVEKNKFLRLWKMRRVRRRRAG